MSNTEQDKAAKLAALKAERAQLAQENAQIVEKSLLDEEIEKEARALELEKAVKDAKEKLNDPLGKKFAVVQTDLGGIILKRANHVLFRRFQDTGEATAEEFEKLVRPCIMYPLGGKFDSMIEEQPAILGRCANAVALLAGVKMKELSGK